MEGSREIVKAIVAGENVARTGFWLGNPDPKMLDILLGHFDCPDNAALRRKLGDDFSWVCLEWNCYRDPSGRRLFEFPRAGDALSAAGPFADCEDVGQVDEFAWPNPDYVDYGMWIDQLRRQGDVYRASGFWSPFFHLACDMFGMENYFIKMYTNPDVVHAVTQRIVDFYLEANSRLFELAGDEIDGFFFGNDFGSQLDLLIGPEQFGEFVFPYFRQLTEMAKQFGRQVILHSCGSIYKVIDDLIGLGVDALHPIQALAANMDAATLARDFGGKVAFIGGIDTQDLLVNGSPQQVRDEVLRIRQLLGPRLVVSPSHECLLPNVPPENIRAMAEAARE